jgi:hypothetical protein
MAAEEDSEECTSKLLSTITQTTVPCVVYLPSVLSGRGSAVAGGGRARRRKADVSCYLRVHP